MKKYIIIVLVLLFLFIIVGCESSSKEEKTKKTDAVKFKEEFEDLNGSRSDTGKIVRVVSIPEKNPIVYSTAEEISKLIDDEESFYVLFGYASCPWTRSMIEEMFKAAEDNDVDTIYYVDVSDIRDIKEVDSDGNINTTKDGDKYYMRLLEQLDGVLEEYKIEDEDGNEISVGEKRIYTPNVIAVKDGKAEQLEKGIPDGLDDPYSEMTVDMENGSYKQLECIFKCLEKSFCTKSAC